MIKNRDKTYQRFKNYLLNKGKISCRLCKKTKSKQFIFKVEKI